MRFKKVYGYYFHDCTVSLSNLNKGGFHVILTLGVRHSNCRQHPPRLFTDYFACTILKKKSIIQGSKNFLRGLKNEGKTS